MHYRKINGDKIYLSPMDKTTESPLMARWLSEDHDIAFNNGFYTRVFTDAATDQMLDRFASGPAQLSIYTQASDELIGQISLFNIDPYSISCTMGIYIAEPYRGHGYGSEAMKLMINHAFDYLRIHCIHLEVMDDNDKAIKVYEKLGFSQCGAYHQCRYVNGHYAGVVLMELINPKV